MIPGLFGWRCGLLGAGEVEAHGESDEGEEGGEGDGDPARDAAGGVDAGAVGEGVLEGGEEVGEDAEGDKGNAHPAGEGGGLEGGVAKSEGAEEEAEAGDDEAEAHHGEAGAHPGEGGSLGGEGGAGGRLVVGRWVGWGPWAWGDCSGNLGIRRIAARVREGCVVSGFGWCVMVGFPAVVWWYWQG
jgi:hypothetical protein